MPVAADSENPNGRAVPAYRNHYLPRSRSGWLAVAVFLGLFALTEPPFVHITANRIEPWIVGFPFLFAYLFGLYAAMIAVLVWARRRGL